MAYINFHAIFFISNLKNYSIAALFVCLFYFPCDAIESRHQFLMYTAHFAILVDFSGIPLENMKATSYDNSIKHIILELDCN